MAGCGCEDACSSEAVSADPVYRRVLIVVLVVNAAMFGIEAVAGWIAGSASLQGDSLDFLGDAANYGIALMVLGHSLKWRASAALLKGATMGLFGLGVVGYTAWRMATVTVPTAEVMGGVGLLALAANVISAALLFRHRAGDSNRRSVWICSRNDAIANVAVLIAAGLVAGTGHGWPDWLVGFGIAGLSLWSAGTILSHARADLRAAQA